MSKHTPGPWTSRCVPTSIGHAHKIEPIRACLYVDHRDARHSDARTTLAAADARLISAAPDLLNALKECLPSMGWRTMSDEELEHEHELGNGFAKPILRARAAIRKAEGNI